MKFKDGIKISLFYFAAVFVLSICGCGQKEEVRAYQEVFVDVDKKESMGNLDPHAFMRNMPQDDIHANLNLDSMGSGVMKIQNNMPDDDIHANLRPNDMQMMTNNFMSGASAPLTWKSPKEWDEKKGSGMRMVTFMGMDKKYPVETSIVALPGQAGGMAANVGRWLGQLKLAVPSVNELTEFISKQEKVKTDGGDIATVIDFTQLQKDADPQTQSMVAAIIETSDTQIFIKMTGVKQAVLNNLKPFQSLVQSIRMGTAP